MGILFSLFFLNWISSLYADFKMKHVKPIFIYVWMASLVNIWFLERKLGMFILLHILFNVLILFILYHSGIFFIQFSYSCDLLHLVLVFHLPLSLDYPTDPKKGAAIPSWLISCFRIVYMNVIQIILEVLNPLLTNKRIALTSTYVVCGNFFHSNVPCCIQ